MLLLAQGLHGALTCGVQSDFVVTFSGGLFGLFGPLRAAKRAAHSSRPSWVVLPCRQLSQRDEKMRDKANYRASFTLPNRLPLKPTVVQFTVGKPSQIGRCARFIPSNLVRCEQFDNDIPVAFRIHL